MYQIFFHKLVIKEDLKKISPSDERRLKRVIHKKLTENPQAFGKPLVGDLKGFYRLRVDPYRIVYRVDGQKVMVFILHIGMRRDFEVYLEAAHRLKLL